VFFKLRLRARFFLKREKGERLKEVVLEGPVGPEITVWGKRYLFFGGTDYLGMAGRPEVLEGARRAIDRFGISSSGSRISSGTNPLHLELEAAISRFTLCEDAVLLSSGYLGMTALLAAVGEREDRVFLQREAHSSIKEAAAMSGMEIFEFSLEDLGSLEKLLSRPDPSGGKIILAAEGVSPLYGTIFPLKEVLRLLQDRDFLILLDDAHAFGVLGEQGRGTAEYHAEERPEVLSCATLSKAFGSFGGCVAGSRTLTEAIRKRALAYSCSTPAPAPVVGAALAAFEYLARNPGLIGRLHKNARLLKDGLAGIGLPVDNRTVPIAPVCLDKPERLEALAQKLLEAGILTPLTDYPGSPAGGLIRLAVSAAHSEDQISYLLSCLKRFI